MHTTVTTLKESKQLDNTSFQDSTGFNLLSGVIENFVDGIVILTEQGKWIYANALAHQIFQKLLQGMSQPNLVPKEVLGVCQSMTKSQIVVSDEKFFTESKISTGKPAEYRIRAKWLSLEETETRYLLVTIEDCFQSVESHVKLEARNYRLTDSETKIWLLRRAGYSNKEIAEQLQISINTVKKHMKNIHAKRKSFLDIEY